MTCSVVSKLLMICLLCCCLIVMAFDKDPYKVLGVRKSATQPEIKSAYRQKAKETHPDKNPNDQEAAKDRFSDVAAAYEILSDDDSRRRYDQVGHEPRNRQQHQHQRSGGFNFNFQGNMHEFHRRAFEQHQKQQQESARRRAESIQNAQHRQVDFPLG